MSMFDFSVAKNANQVTSTFLRGGIHNVTYKGIEWVASQSEGNSDAFVLLFETKDGIQHRETIFDPSNILRELQLSMEKIHLKWKTLWLKLLRSLMLLIPN